jgi:hypothetical protein
MHINKVFGVRAEDGKTILSSGASRFLQKEYHLSEGVPKIPKTLWWRAVT